MKRTPLYDRHREMGAKTVEFGGWEMPVQYTGIIDEHNATRNAAGLFDISHMGQVDVRGPDALAFLQHIATQDVATIADGMANYSLLCYPDGGIVDDIFIYHLPGPLSGGGQRLQRRQRLRLDAAARRRIRGRAGEHLGSHDYAGAAGAEGRGDPGPSDRHRRDGAIVPWGRRPGVSSGDVPAIIARTGYTGEDGFELFFDNEYAHVCGTACLKQAQDDGLKPIGLGARDSLRFEPKLALYGHEICEDDQSV